MVEREVRNALLRAGAVVALESTIICHGMPFPQNLKTAQEVESIIRENGAIPATIAIIDGTPYVGLTPLQLFQLAQNGHMATKTSRRDIAAVIAKGGTGATTVSATMFFAAKVGIPVFVTGGIGGVHRGGHETMDVSADLTELGRTPVAVVCAGVKSILDIPRTLEYLETQGVTVGVLGSHEFPAFFTPSSGSKAPLELDSIQECAALICANRRMNIASGMVIAVPIPEAEAAEGRMIEDATTTALQEAEERGVEGHLLTPFLLRRIAQLTGGLSLSSNISLVKNNARIGAQISVLLQQLFLPSRL